MQNAIKKHLEESGKRFNEKFDNINAVVVINTTHECGTTSRYIGKELKSFLLSEQKALLKVVAEEVEKMKMVENEYEGYEYDFSSGDHNRVIDDILSILKDVE